MSDEIVIARLKLEISILNVELKKREARVHALIDQIGKMSCCCADCTKHNLNLKIPLEGIEDGEKTGNDL